jgi:hypothetical protein
MESDVILTSLSGRVFGDDTWRTVRWKEKRESPGSHEVNWN